MINNRVTITRRELRAAWRYSIKKNFPIVDLSCALLIPRTYILDDAEYYLFDRLRNKPKKGKK